MEHRGKGYRTISRRQNGHRGKGNRQKGRSRMACKGK